MDKYMSFAVGRDACVVIIFNKKKTNGKDDDDENDDVKDIAIDENKIGNPSCTLRKMKTIATKKAKEKKKKTISIATTTLLIVMMVPVAMCMAGIIDDFLVIWVLVLTILLPHLFHC